MVCSLERAFDKVCADAKLPSAHYVCLMENRPFYGGPEEGGWWGNDFVLIKYKLCSTEEEAETIKQAVEKLAEELSKEAEKAYGEQCLAEMEWLEDRGLEAHDLREPDGPSNFYVDVRDSPPESAFGKRYYD